MQHGVFSNTSDDYIRGTYNYLAHYLPHKTLVWGEGFKRVIVEDSAFGKDEVVFTGNPRTDILAKIRSLLDKETIFPMCGL